MKKKRLVKLLSLMLAALMLVMLAACGDGNSGSSGGSDSTPAGGQDDAGSDSGGTSDISTTIELWFNPLHATEDAQMAWINRSLQSFYAQYPNVTVNITIVPWADAATRLALAMSTGNGAPHVYYTYPEQVWEYAEAGYLLPLQGHFASDMNDIIGIEDNSWEGDFYSVPILFGVNVYVYNVSMLNDIGWDVNNLPTTIEEYDNFLAAAKDHGVHGAWIPYFMFDHLSGLLNKAWSMGYDYVDRAGNVTVKNEVWERIFHYQKLWFDNGYTPEAALVEMDVAAPFLDQRVASTYLSASFLRGDDFQNTPFDWVVGPTIKYDNTATEAATGIACGMSMTTYIEYPEVGADLIRAIASVESIEDMNTEVGFFPPRRSASNIFANLKNFDVISDYVAAVPLSYGATWNFITSVMAEQIRFERQAMLMGEKSIPDAMDAIERLLIAALAERE